MCAVPSEDTISEHFRNYHHKRREYGKVTFLMHLAMVRHGVRVSAGTLMTGHRTYQKRDRRWKVDPQCGCSSSGTHCSCSLTQPSSEDGSWFAESYQMIPSKDHKLAQKELQAIS